MPNVLLLLLRHNTVALYFRNKSTRGGRIVVQKNYPKRLEVGPSKLGVAWM